MTDSSDSAPVEELPRRLAGELHLPEPLTPLYFETRDEVLTRVRDGLEDYEPPEVTESSANFRWMQPAEDLNNSQPIRGSDA